MSGKKMGFEKDRRLKKDYGTTSFRAKVGDDVYKFDTDGEYYVALWLEWRKTRGAIRFWQREGSLYRFVGYDSGPQMYLPDFLTAESDGKIVVVEFKSAATLDQQAIKKLERMVACYPSVSVELIMDRITQGMAVNKRASASKYIRNHQILDFSEIKKETIHEIKYNRPVKL
jgi:hypothetical protein